MSEGLKRIVVIGAGFGGLTFCQHFSHPRARITLVDRTNHHLFQPLLYQVAMAGLSAPDIAQPVRSILSKYPRLEVLMDEVKDFDLPGRRLIFNQQASFAASGLPDAPGFGGQQRTVRTVDYEYLVLAFGGVTSYFGHPEWAQYAPGMKTLEDALRIRRNVLLAFERAENEPNPEEQSRLMTIVIVGGGPTGVELAGACAELAHRVLRRDFDRIDPARAKIILVEALPRILTQFPDDLADKALRQLERLGVEVRTSSPVKAIAPGSIAFDKGEVIKAGNILWGAGVMANPLTKKLGVELDRAGRIKVKADLSLPGHLEVFAIGDIVSVLQSNGHPVPGVAPAAMQMARHVAGLIANELDHDSLHNIRRPFRYRNKGNLATIGRSAAIAEFGRIKLSGFPAWFAWLVVHLIFLIGFRNKLSVLVSWMYAYVTFKLGARIITGWPEPARSGQGIASAMSSVTESSQNHDAIAGNTRTPERRHAA